MLDGMCNLQGHWLMNHKYFMRTRRDVHRSRLAPGPVRRRLIAMNNWQRDYRRFYCIPLLTNPIHPPRSLLPGIPQLASFHLSS